MESLFLRKSNEKRITHLHKKDSNKDVFLGLFRVFPGHAFCQKLLFWSFDNLVEFITSITIIQTAACGINKLSWLIFLGVPTFLAVKCNTKTLNYVLFKGVITF